jgi:hypothetical protein
MERPIARREASKTMDGWNNPHPDSRGIHGIWAAPTRLILQTEIVFMKRRRKGL